MPVDVTVITVVRNALEKGRRSMLLQCLDSVRKQTGVAVEHLLVDGASDDGTLALLQTYAKDAECVRVYSGKDDGIYDAMNKGIQLARGRFIIFLNSDDFYNDPNGLSESVSALDRTGADFSYSPTVILGELSGWPALHPNWAPNVRRIFTEMVFSHQGVLVRRDKLVALGGFDAKYRVAADYDLVLRMIFSGAKAVAVKKIFAVFRLGGYSCKYSELSVKEVGRIFSTLYTRYSGFNVDEVLGVDIFKSKILPDNLKKALDFFRDRTFGGCEDLSRIWGDELSYGIVRSVIAFRRRLRPFKSGGRVRDRLLSAVKTVAIHPLWSAVYVWLYVKTIGTVEPSRRARVAYNEFAGWVFARCCMRNHASIRKGCA
jgi:glycosyltransferase involved in cell wall biosynthesis